MNNAIYNRNIGSSSKASSFGKNRSESTYDRLIMTVVKIMRWCELPAVRFFAALFMSAFAVVSFIVYAVAFMSGSISVLTGILLMPVMIGIIGLAAKSVS